MRIQFIVFSVLWLTNVELLPMNRQNNQIPTVIEEQARGNVDEFTLLARNQIMTLQRIRQANRQNFLITAILPICCSVITIAVLLKFFT